MKNLNFPVMLIFTCCLFVGISCKKDDPSNVPIIIEESTPVTDYDGNTYKTVRIGDQIWMAENLRTTHYSDGTPVQNFIYNNEETNVSKYGRLYRWAAAMRNATSSNSNPSGIQGVSPVGWHIPSNAEWLELVNNLGGSSVAGGKLKSIGTTDWVEPNTGATNESLCNALPAGFYRVDGVYMKLNEWCIFNTSTSTGVEGISVCMLKNNSNAIISEMFHPLDAVSVRCVKN
jgi:uncharacterized protein (TIGR02145 family)